MCKYIKWRVITFKLVLDEIVMQFGSRAKNLCTGFIVLFESNLLFSVRGFAGISAEIRSVLWKVYVLLSNYCIMVCLFVCLSAVFLFLNKNMY